VTIIVLLVTESKRVENSLEIEINFTFKYLDVINGCLGIKRRVVNCKNKVWEQ